MNFLSKLQLDKISCHEVKQLLLPHHQEHVCPFPWRDRPTKTHHCHARTINVAVIGVNMEKLPPPPGLNAKPVLEPKKKTFTICTSIVLFFSGGVTTFHVWVQLAYVRLFRPWKISQESLNSMQEPYPPTKSSFTCLHVALTCFYSIILKDRIQKTTSNHSP